MFQSLTFFVWINPIARSAQRKAPLNQTSDKYGPKSQAANVRRLQYPQAARFRAAQCHGLRSQTTPHFFDDAAQRRERCVFARCSFGKLNALDCCQESAA